MQEYNGISLWVFSLTVYMYLFMLDALDYIVQSQTEIMFLINAKLEYRPCKTYENKLQL